MTRVGWYVHHHGFGHLGRLLAIAPHLDAEIRCFSSLPARADLPPHCTWQVLEDDTGAGTDGDAQPHDPTAGGLLHWAPLGHPRHRARLARIAAASADLDAFVIDVSVEVALFARLLGLPTVVIAQPGVRSDPPHALGYGSATTIIAPWPEDLLAPAHLRGHRDRVVFTGGVSRFDGRPVSGERDGIVLLGSAGGSAVSTADVRAAERATGASWQVLGGDGWVDPWPALSAAAVVVSFAGQNSIADLAAADAAAVVVPQQRPFDEQAQTAAALDRAGLAVVVPHWPTPDDWPGALDRAGRLQPDWSRWQVAGAAARAAAAIMRTAGSAR